MLKAVFNLRDFFKVSVCGLSIFAVFLGIFSYFPELGKFLEGLHPVFSFSVQYVIQLLILLFPLWIFVVLPYCAKLKDFGFEKVSAITVIKTVAFLYFVFIAVSSVLMFIAMQYGIEIPGYAKQDSFLPMFGDDAIGLIIAFFVVVLVAPFVEELFFRGFAYRVFLNRFPNWLASGTSAFLFAIMHLQVQSLLPLFFLGLLMNYAYYKTGSVWTSFYFHLFNNLVAISVELLLL